MVTQPQTERKMHNKYVELKTDLQNQDRHSEGQTEIRTRAEKSYKTRHEDKQADRETVRHTNSRTVEVRLTE